jgi:hypothetical protein
MSAALSHSIGCEQIHWRVDRARNGPLAGVTRDTAGARASRAKRKRSTDQVVLLCMGSSTALSTLSIGI